MPLNTNPSEKKLLAEMLAQNEGLSFPVVLELAESLARQLQAIHQSGEVYGALDVEAVQFDAQGRVRLVEGRSPEDVSACYLSPEVRAGEQPTPRADFYSLGAVLYHALTGNAPEEDIQDPWPGNRVPGLPPELDELVARCLNPLPERRVQSAAEFLNGLEEVRRGQHTSAQDTILGVEDQLVGHTLGGYQLVERLGQGGMATVYKAYESALDRYVAVKVLPEFFARDPNFSQRFRREAKAVAQLNHPNILPIYSFGEEDGVTYIAMQFVEGGTLKKQRGQVYEPLQAVRLTLPVARALAYAHRRGVVHRDIKPSNVLISEDGWPILADFGLAKMAEATTQLTGSGVGIGTPAYMSPEQGQGVEVDHRSDIYSLGIMLYEMLTGDVPFKADTPMAVVIKHITAPMPPPRSVNPDIPEMLERVILKATAKNPADRYQTADELVEALERVEHELTVAKEVLPSQVAGELAPAQRLSWEAARRGGKWVWGALFGLALVIAFLVWSRMGGTALPLLGEPQPTATLPVASATLGDLLFRDEFVDKPSAEWIFKPQAWDVTEVDGRYALRSPVTQETVTAELRSMGWENYAVAFDFRFEQPDQFGDYYFFLRGRLTDCPPTVKALQSYTVMVSPNQVNLDKETCAEGGKRELSLSGKKFDFNNWHTALLLFNGDTLDFYIDGDEYFEFKDDASPLDGGDLWIETSGGVQVLISNLRVYEVVPAAPGQEPAVPTSTPPISPEASCPSGQTLVLAENFEDQVAQGWDFSDVLGESAPSWTIETEDDGNRAWRGDGYWAIYNSMDLLDYAVSLRLRMDASGATHLNIRMGEERYYFAINGDVITLNRDPGEKQLASATAVISDDAWHDVQIAARGDLVTFDLDGVRLIEYRDPNPIAGGVFGIEAAGGSLWYDDVLICGVPTSGEGAQGEGNTVGNMFLDSGQRLGERGVLSLAAGDINGDGNLDLAAGSPGQTNWTFLNRGDGRFIKSYETVPADNTTEALLGDFDLDGDADLAVINTFSPGIVWVNEGGGNFAKGQELTRSDSFSLGGTWGGALADLNGDNAPDIWEAAGGANYVWINDGRGSFSLLGEGYPGGDSVGVALGDLDGDGDNDAFVANYNGGANFVYLNNGDGTFEDSGQRLGNAPSNDVALGDFDGDGDLDAFILNRDDTPNEVWVNDGTGRFSDSGQRLGNSSSQAAAVGDLDNDGDLDVYVANGWDEKDEAQANAVYLNDGSGVFTRIELAGDPAASQDVLLMDLDADGWLDVVEATTETILIWFNQGKPEEATGNGPGSQNLAEQARIFAEPILQAIADRPPDYADEFDDNKSAWEMTFHDYPMDRINIEAGVLRAYASGLVHISNNALRYRDFVLEATGIVEESPSGHDDGIGITWGDYTCTLVLFTGSHHWETRYCGQYDCEPNYDEGYDPDIQVGVPVNILLISRGGEFAVYLNDSPLTYESDPRCASGGEMSLAPHVDDTVDAERQSIISFDNLKIWDISDLELPALETQVTPSPTLPNTLSASAYMYDDFSGDTGNQPYDITRWDVSVDQSAGDFTVLQENGVLRLSLKGERWGGIGMDARSYFRYPLGDLSVVEARVMIASDFTGGPSDIQFEIQAGQNNGGSIMWRLGANEAASAKPQLAAGRFYPTGTVDWAPLAYEMPAEFDTWYTVRIEIHAEEGRYVFYLNGAKVGEISVEDDVWNNPEAPVVVSFWSAVEAGTQATYYLDDVVVRP